MNWVCIHTHTKFSLSLYLSLSKKKWTVSWHKNRTGDGAGWGGGQETVHGVSRGGPSSCEPWRSWNSYGATLVPFVPQTYTQGLGSPSSSSIPALVQAGGTRLPALHARVTRHDNAACQPGTGLHPQSVHSVPHPPLPCLSRTHFNILIPSQPGSLLLTFPHQNYNSISVAVLRASGPAHLILN